MSKLFHELADAWRYDKTMGQLSTRAQIATVLIPLLLWVTLIVIAVSVS
jgi:hypothetical protein